MIKQAAPKAWCIARRDAPTSKLQEVLDYLCGKYDCKEILPGGQCFPPDTVYDHASYAINLNYRSTIECDLEYSLPTFADPCKLFSCSYLCWLIKLFYVGS